MSNSYVVMPLKKEIKDFRYFKKKMIDEEKFELKKVIEKLELYYPNIHFSDEGNNVLFAHYKESYVVEIWIHDNCCMFIDDDLKKVIDIGNSLDMSVFDIEGDQLKKN